jgi:adenosylmethionine-8-amino-7-oxononanoate aminotransferase
MMGYNEIQKLDQEHVWHPYASIPKTLPCLPVKKASGCDLHLVGGRVTVDGMLSCWACIHGSYNHPVLNMAAEEQIYDMVHVMFGGLMHQPAVSLAKALLEVIPTIIEYVKGKNIDLIRFSVAILEVFLLNLQ